MQELIKTDSDNFIFLRYRQKNKETLKKYDLTMREIRKIILSLKVSDYYKTTYDNIVEQTSQTEINIFCKEYNGIQLYIKLKMKQVEGQNKVFCFSCHEAEIPMYNLPYAKKNILVCA